MTRSMTAFSRHEHGAAVWEIRSVNHRYLDVSFRMPENLRHLETELKSQFKDKVQRGKIECTLKISAGELKTRIQYQPESGAGSARRNGPNRRNNRHGRPW